MPNSSKSLEQQAAIDERVGETSTRLEERQAQRDRGKTGITDDDLIQCMNMVIAQERESARKEFKAAVVEMQCEALRNVWIERDLMSHALLFLFGCSTMALYAKF